MNACVRLGLIVAVFLIAGGCATTRPTNTSPAERETVIAEQYQRGIEAANEDMRGAGPSVMMFLISIPLYLSDEPVKHGAGMLFGATAVSMGIRRLKSNPDTVPSRRLSGLTEEERESFIRGYMDQLQAREEDSKIVAPLGIGLAVIAAFILYRLPMFQL